MSEHVLITGGAGFIGTRLARRLADDGHTVTVLDALLPQVHGPEPRLTSPSLPLLEGVAEFVHGSVDDPDAVHAVIRGASIVVHLAADTGTGQSMYEVDRYVRTNVGGTATLLEALPSAPSVRRVVVSSTRAVYGEGAYRTRNGAIVFPGARSELDLERGEFDVRFDGEGDLTPVPTTESTPPAPTSVYGITKLAQESLIRTVAPSFGVEAVALRYQNVYGPGQSLRNPYTGIMSIFSSLIRRSDEINIFEDGLMTRDFVFIDDVVEATARAVTVPRAAGSVINVGSGRATTVLDVVRALGDAFGSEPRTRVSGSFRVGDIRHNVADTGRMADILGIHGTIALDEGVRRLVEWVGTQPDEGAVGYQESIAEMRERNLLK